jgi:hypothetical protein
MIYENKIKWPAMAILSRTQDPFRDAVLDYQIQVEGALGDIIKRHFRDQRIYNMRYVQFRNRVNLARALIGETPDDAFWPLIETLGDLRNHYSHSRYTRTEAGREKTKAMVEKILRQISEVWPEIEWREHPDQIAIIQQAHMMVQGFLQEINRALDTLGLPKPYQD